MKPTHDIRVSVQTTWWNRQEGKFGFYAGWPNEKYAERQMEAYNDLLNKDAKHSASRKRRGDPARVNNVSLHTALTNRSNVSAYLVQYKPTALKVRFNTTIFDGRYREAYEMLKDVSPNGIEMHLAIIDMDCHGGDANSWFQLQLPKLERLAGDFPGLLYWRSKNGFRILGYLPTAFTINNRDDAKAWTRQYAAWCKFLARKYLLKTEGKETADQLGDWTRYQRVPRDTRVKGEPVEEFPLYGNPEFVGYWNPELQPEDWPVAVAARSTDHLDYQGACQLHTLILNSGLRCDETLNPAVFDIHCPAHEEHSETEDRKTKTYLYVNGPIGKIECKSSSCGASHPDRMKSYLRHFPADAVRATSPARNWRNQPRVAELFERRIAEQDRVLTVAWDTTVDPSWEEFESAKVSAMGIKDKTPAEVKEFSRWFTTQTVYKDHKSPVSWQAWLDSCAGMMDSTCPSKTS